MDAGHYVNSPADESSNREKQNCQSGGLKIFKLVGISFGLLCVIQAALNVSLRLQAVGRSDNMSAINFTMTSADDIRDLILERNQLLQDKDQLVKEKKRLQLHNRHLSGDKKMLNDKVAKQQNKIQELETKVQNTPSCPQGWWRYMSSCYLTSSKTDTWENAKRDCVRHGAHLVIFNDETEERVTRSFGGSSNMWMGLQSQLDESSYRRTWTWADGSRPVYINWNDPLPRRNGCPYVGLTTPWTNAWFKGACEAELYWMCEKELHKSDLNKTHTTTSAKHRET